MPPQVKWRFRDIYIATMQRRYQRKGVSVVPSRWGVDSWIRDGNCRFLTGGTRFGQSRHICPENQSESAHNEKSLCYRFVTFTTFMSHPDIPLLLTFLSENGVVQSVRLQLPPDGSRIDPCSPGHLCNISFVTFERFKEIGLFKAGQGQRTGGGKRDIYVHAVGSIFNGKIVGALGATLPYQFCLPPQPQKPVR